jgi:hypothetical protein
MAHHKRIIHGVVKHKPLEMYLMRKYKSVEEGKDIFD